MGEALAMFVAAHGNTYATLLNSKHMPGRCSPPLTPAYSSTSLHTIKSSRVTATQPRTRHGFNPGRKVLAFEESVDGLVTLLLANFPDFRKVVEKVV